MVTAMCNWIQWNSFNVEIVIRSFSNKLNQFQSDIRRYLSESMRTLWYSYLYINLPTPLENVHSIYEHFQHCSFTFWTSFLRVISSIPEMSSNGITQSFQTRLCNTVYLWQFVTTVLLTKWKRFVPFKVITTHSRVKIIKSSYISTYFGICKGEASLLNTVGRMHRVQRF